MNSCWLCCTRPACRDLKNHPRSPGWRTQLTFREQKGQTLLDFSSQLGNEAVLHCCSSQEHHPCCLEEGEVSNRIVSLEIYWWCFFFFHFIMLPTYELASYKLSRMQACLPSASDTRDISVFPLPPITDDSSALPSPMSSPRCSQWLFPGHSVPAPAGQQLHCTFVLFKVLYCQNKKVFVFAFLMCCLWEKYYTAITMQYYLVDCVSWVPTLTLLDLLTNWTYEHSPNRPYSYVGELLSITTFLIPQGYLVY